MEYGKFETLEQLIAGYNNLEKEFTKKCQELSEIIKKNNRSAENQNGTSETVCATIEEVCDCADDELPPRGGTGDAVNPENSTDIKANLTRIPDESSLDENALNSFILQNKKLADRIFELYLFRHSLNRAPKVIGGGGCMPAAPQTKPKNLEEASALSKHLFK